VARRDTRRRRGGHAAYLEESGMRATRALEGSRGTLVLRRELGELAE